MKNKALPTPLLVAIVAFVLSLILLAVAVWYNVSAGGSSEAQGDDPASSSSEDNGEGTVAGSGEQGSYVGAPQGEKPLTALEILAGQQFSEGWERQDNPISSPPPSAFRVDHDPPIEDPLRKYNLRSDEPDRVPLGTREGFDEAIEHVNARKDFYQARVDDGSFWRIAPDGFTADYSYNRSFWLHLVDFVGKFPLAGQETFSREPIGDRLTAATEEDADRAIAEIRGYVDELERRFYAGEPLDMSGSIEQGNGTWFYFNGTYGPWREANLESGWMEETLPGNRD